MLGTGECASSSSESTIPSCTSSSCTLGTYWRQMGSSGDLIRSTIAGEIRNSKFSAACLRRSSSGKCSAPKRAASTSRDAMLFLRSSSCQDSMCQVLEIDHQVIPGRIVLRDYRGPVVPAGLVKPTRRRVVRARRRLHNDKPTAISHQRLLDMTEET